MNRLKEYLNLDEKGNYFEEGTSFIDTKDDFNNLWRSLSVAHNQEQSLYRGVSEAKYKLYTSSQRFWIEQQLDRQNKSYISFIERLIIESRNWNNSTITNLFNAYQINDVFSYLSYMQHFGVPTPLLDFSHNPFVGLFFAVNTIRKYPSGSSIDYYCSLYIADTNNQYYADIEELSKSIDEDESQNKNFYDPMTNHPIRLVQADESNSNVVNQEGVFFYNNHPLYPLEEVYRENVDSMKGMLGDKEFREKGYTNHFAKCINIHKGLREYVLAKLKTLNIDSNFIYPDNRKLAEYAITKALAHDDTKLPLIEAKECVAENNLERAIDIIIDYSRRNHIKDIKDVEAILLAVRLNDIERKNRMGTISIENYNTEMNKITEDIIKTIDVIEKRIS